MLIEPFRMNGMKVSVETMALGRTCRHMIVRSPTPNARAARMKSKWRARNFEYVTAARALGLSNIKIMFKHLLPNAMVATLTFMPFILNGSITTLTSLDFLGFGLPPGSPSLGELLAQGKDNLQAPWLGLTAFFVIAIMLSLLIFVGEAVRDALDPRKTWA